MEYSKPHWYKNLFAKTKGYKDRKEGPISEFVVTAITNCITNKWLLNIFYEPGEDENMIAGYRWIECYVYGLNRYTLNHHCRAYEYKGVGEEGFKTWRLDRIRNTAVISSKTFNKPRPLYNPDGDEDMSEIFLQVSFSE